MPKISSIFSWETGALIFAILNLMVCALSVAGVFGVLLHRYVNEFPPSDASELGVAACSSVFLLVFAVILLYGILKKHLVCISTYLVMGAFVLCLSNASVLLEPMIGFRWSSSSLIMIIIGQAVYALILAMIYGTCRKIKAANDLNEHFNIKITNTSLRRLKQFSICSSETGTMVFAVLNLVGAVLGLLTGIAGLIPRDWIRYCNEWEFVARSEISLFIIVFAAFLFHGVLNKHAGHILAYFVMGAIILSLSIIGFLFLMVIGLSYYNYALFALTATVQVVYALILAMIYNTYKKIKTSKDQEEQKIFLIENMTLSTPVHKLLC